MRVNAKEIDLQKMTISHKTLDVFLDVFLLEQGYDIQRVAVEHNGCIIKRKDFSTLLLKDEDVLEVVEFVGGG